MASEPRPVRLSLGRSRRRLSFERRLRLWLTAFAAASILPLELLVYLASGKWSLVLILGATLGITWAFAGTIFLEQLIRPLQTLANIASALREGDFSFRVRGALRGDAMGDLALEINELASDLQRQRTAARDALSLVESVMLTMASPVFVFDSENRLRLLNAAAEHAFSLERTEATGRSAAELNLSRLTEATDADLLSGSAEASLGEGPVRWSMRRTAFRLQGIPHTLLMLTDISAVLREKERAAWQRLIRVLGHEINNSLTPIKSIASSLRSRVSEMNSFPSEDFARGLSIIEDRSASLNRFLQAYQQLSRLPHPTLAETDLGTILQQVVALETRVIVQVRGEAAIRLMADADQLQQMLINLLQNATDAALSVESRDHTPSVEVVCKAIGTQAVVGIRDNGPGLANPANLFVPFYTTKPAGTGIGLVLAQQIASGHRGSVTLRNRTDSAGCEAEVRLPLLR